MKKYTKDELTITWDHKKCIHSEKCWRNLGNVFKPRERPWIQPDGAKIEEIVNQIDQCPSGALGYFYNNQRDETSIK